MSIRETPSYARPTASSRARASRQPSQTTPAPSPPTSPAKTTSTSPSSPRTPRAFQSSQSFKTAYLSTSVSRSRAVRPCFRFFDLPADVRNIVYAYYMREHRYRWLWSITLTLPSSVYRYKQAPYRDHALPPLLRVMNKQFREEVGSYYFTRNLNIYYSEKKQLQFFLRQIGRVNCERLVQNRDAWLRSGGDSRYTYVDLEIDRKVLESFVDVSELWVSKAWNLEEA